MSTKNPTPRRYHKRSFSTSTAHEYHSSAIRCLLGSVQNMRVCAQPQICKTAKTQRQFARYTIQINSSKSIDCQRLLPALPHTDWRKIISSRPTKQLSWIHTFYYTESFSVNITEYFSDLFDLSLV